MYLLVAAAYGLVGAALSVTYYFSPRLREEPAFHLVTVIAILLAVVAAPLGIAASAPFTRLEAFHRGAQFFLFLGASLLYLPVVLFLVLHYWELALERITSPGSRAQPDRGPRSEKEEWSRVERCLERVAADPTDVGAHERLGDLYASMGFAGSAVYEYRKAADWLERGYAQGLLLYKAARLLVEKKGDVPSALPILRRIVRLYPKSYFASYARRIINHHEAHEGLEPDAHPESAEGKEPPA